MAVVVVAGISATALLVSCADESSIELRARDEVVESSAQSNLEIARSLRVGAAPTAVFVPTALPRGFLPEAIVEPLLDTTGGGVSVTVYGRENARPGGPALVALVDRSGVFVALDGEDDAIEVGGHRGGMRSAHGAELIQWLSGEEQAAAVIGFGLGRDEVRAAVREARVGQRMVIGKDGRPDDFVELAAGDVWSASSSIRGSALLAGYLLRYSNPDTGAVVEISAASGGERLQRLAHTALAPQRTIRLGSRQVTRGGMVSTPSPDDFGAVWSENGHVIVVASDGLSPGDFDRVVASVEEVSPERWLELRGQVAQYPPLAPDGAVVLFEGVTEDGTRWVWYLDGDRTNFVSRGVSGDGPGHEGPVLAEDPSPLRAVGVYLAGAFIGGVTDTATARVVIELRSGETIEASLIDHPTDPAIRFFGAKAPQEQTAAVVAYAADGSERERARR